MFPLAAALGAAVVALPALASAEETIQAIDEPGEIHRWSPLQVTVNTGATVAIKGSATVLHGVHWTSAVTPNCTGVPGASTGLPSFSTGWSGKCTFASPGTYTFYCTYHGPSMSGTITVNANGTTTTTTTTGSPPPTTGTTPPPGYERPGGGQPGSTAPQYGAAPGSPLAGSASSAVRVASAQHGGVVHGTVEISQAGAGGRLEVDLFAKKALLASAGGAQASAGRLVLSRLHAGKVSFSVPLNSRARKALRRHHRLALTVRIQVQAPGASAQKITRSLVLRP